MLLSVIFEIDMNNEIVIYKSDDLTKVEVKISEDTVWLNRNQIAELFGRDVKTIGKHINNSLQEELVGLPTVAKFATVQQEGERMVERQIEHYNLDVVISVGYRVKSQRGIQFRIWANQILKDHLLKGYSLNNRMNRIEDDVHELKEKVSEIDFQIHTTLPSTQGLFFDGQFFDAHVLAGKIIRSAQKSITIIDNYIDDTVLTLLTDKKPGIPVHILTKSISEKLKLASKKFNKQYGNLKIAEFGKSHDRFIIIDDNDIYHLGASLKDLGKRWFAFSKLDVGSVSILDAVEKIIDKPEKT